MFQLPKIDERLSVIGRTGSGKTQGAAWVLSEQPYHKMPYVIIDYKGDKLLNKISGLEEIGVDDKLPKHPGLYIVHPPVGDQEVIEPFLQKIWERENIGTFFDEGYMIHPRSPMFNAILTQGRSKHIPAIVLTQRPVFCSRFVFSEADHYMIFHLNTKGDIKHVEGFVPGDLSVQPQRFHSRWYNVKTNELFKLLPVPKAEAILQRFEDRSTSTRRKKFI